MSIRTELSLRIANSPGALAGVCRLLSNERVNVTAMALEAGGHLRLVVDNHVHGAAVLREHHHQVTERDVLVTGIPNVPGALAPALKLMADAGVNIEYSYGGAGEIGGTASIVMGVDHVMKASAASGIQILMRLYVEPMDSVVVEVTSDGRVQLEGEELRAPTLQERRAIIYAAQKEIDALTDIIDVLQPAP